MAQRYHFKEQTGHAQNDENRKKRIFTAILINNTRNCFNSCGHGLLGHSCRAHIQDDAGIQIVLVANDTQVRLGQQALLDLGPTALPPLIGGSAATYGKENCSGRGDVFAYVNFQVFPRHSSVDLDNRIDIGALRPRTLHDVDLCVPRAQVATNNHARSQLPPLNVAQIPRS